jgi:hypothetical protein
MRSIFSPARGRSTSSLMLCGILGRGAACQHRVSTIRRNASNGGLTRKAVDLLNRRVCLGMSRHDQPVG